MGYTLDKNERLSGEKRIDALFATGESFIAYPLRIVYLKRDSEAEPLQPPVVMMVSVSKKRFKRAVKRNRVKRLVREAFRLSKEDFVALAANSQTSFDIAFLYLNSELPDYQSIEKAIRKTINILTEKLQPGSDE